MGWARRHPLTLVVAVAIGIGLLGGAFGGAVGGAQDASPVASPMASPMAGTPVAVDAQAATIEAYDIGWRYDGQQSAPNQPVTVPVAPGATISIVSTAAVPHNFSVDALGISVDLPPGETVEVALPVDAASGQYEFYCNVPGHKQAGMVGTLTIG